MRPPATASGTGQRASAGASASRSRWRAGCQRGQRAASANSAQPRGCPYRPGCRRRRSWTGSPHCIPWTGPAYVRLSKIADDANSAPACRVDGGPAHSCCGGARARWRKRLYEGGLGAGDLRRGQSVPALPLARREDLRDRARLEHGCPPEADRPHLAEGPVVHLAGDADRGDQRRSPLRDARADRGRQRARVGQRRPRRRGLGAQEPGHLRPVRGGGRAQVPDGAHVDDLGRAEPQGRLQARGAGQVHADHAHWPHRSARRTCTRRC